MDSPKDNSSPVNKQEKEKAASAKGKKRICNVCNREFSNCYALGGHRRIHNLHKKTNNDPTITKKKVVKKNNSKAQITATNNVNKCYVCAKEFKSKCSLIGHMKAHPDRGWPGLRPPSPSTDVYIISDASSSSNGYSQTSEFLPLSDTSEEDEYEEEEYKDEEEEEDEWEKGRDQEMLDCADALLVLASGKYL